MSEYPKEFLDLVTLDTPREAGVGICRVDNPIIRVSIGTLSVTCKESKSQLINRDIALAGLFAAWNKQKEIEGR